MRILLSLFLGFFSLTAFSAPLADMKIRYKQHEDGSYTYHVMLKNLGPILEMVTTPKNHKAIDWSTLPPTEYDASGKFLNDDQNIVLFGIDTGSDDISISKIRNGKSSFRGSVEQGFADSDGDGIANTVVAWHLPFFGWGLADTLTPGNKLRGIRFTANQKLKKVTFWVGGSDDAQIWDDSHIMLEDQFGIYDATLGQYLAVFLERSANISSFYKDDD